MKNQKLQFESEFNEYNFEKDGMKLIKETEFGKKLENLQYNPLSIELTNAGNATMMKREC